MQFVIIATHAPDMCPTSNSKIRELMREGVERTPILAARLGVKIVTLNVLGPDHQMVGVVEADNIGAVRDFAWESRLVQWSTVHIYPSWTMEETLAKAEELPPIS